MKNDLVGGALTSCGVAAVVARYRASGDSLEAFAKSNGIPHGRLHYWIYGRKQSKGQRAGSVVGKPLFQEVELNGVVPEGSRWAAEVGLSCGLAVRFAERAAPAWIREVVQELRRTC